MLAEIFYWVFNMSLAAALAGVFVLLLRRVRRIPRRFAAALWLAPLLRMWIPAGVGSRYGVMELLSRFAVRKVTLYEDGKETVFSLMNITQGAESYFPLAYRSAAIEKTFHIGALVWLSVVAALIIALAWIYFTTMRELRDARRLRDNIYFSDKVTAPAVYGVLRPRIILPEYCRDSDLSFVLLHEGAHIRRGDNLWRMLAAVTAAVYWFNPLSWVFLRAALTDMELACDEQVIRSCGAERKKAYAAAILDHAERRSLFVSAFGGAAVRVRITHILSVRRLTIAGTIGFGMLTAAVIYALVTNAV